MSVCHFLRFQRTFTASSKSTQPGVSVQGTGWAACQSSGCNPDVVGPGSIWVYGGFLKWWYPTTIGFPTKNDHFGVFWGYHHLRKHPYTVVIPEIITAQSWPGGSSDPDSSSSWYHHIFWKTRNCPISNRKTCKCKGFPHQPLATYSAQTNHHQQPLTNSMLHQMVQFHLSLD